MPFQQVSGSTGQNSPSAAPADAATTSTPTTLAPPSPGRQFASHTLAALLGVQQQQDQAPSAADIAGKVISQADGDGDGQLSQSEVAQALGLSGTNATSDSLTQAFGKLDTNGDGKLSADELTSSIQQRLTELSGHHHHGGHKGVSSQDLASGIIGAGDSNGDGSLSQSELTSELGKGGVTMSSADFAAAFGKLDTNGDGTLSGAELAAAIDALRNKAAGSGSTTADAKTTATTPTTTSTTA